MKIKPEHYSHIKTAMAVRAANISAYRQCVVDEGKAKDVEKRVRWDLLYATVPSQWVCDNLYPYMDDSHIDTALRNIMKEIEV